MEHHTLRVDGMSCGHCVSTIKDALRKLPGIEDVRVDLEKKEVSVEFDEAQSNLPSISFQISAAGFEVVGN